MMWQEQCLELSFWMPHAVLISSSNHTSATVHSRQQVCVFVFYCENADTNIIVHFSGKSCMIILIMVNYEWFEEWKDTPVGKRGDDYLAYKRRFANNIFDWACSQYPRLRDKVAIISEMDFVNTIACNILH